MYAVIFLCRNTLQLYTQLMKYNIVYIGTNNGYCHLFQGIHITLCTKISLVHETNQGLKYSVEELGFSLFANLAYLSARLDKVCLHPRINDRMSTPSKT